MAEVVVRFFVRKVKDLHDEQQEARRVMGVGNQVQDLTTTLTKLQAFLGDADVKQFNDQAVKVWLQELRQIAYDADDVLDEWRTRLLLSQQIGQSYCLFSPYSFFKPVALRHQIGLKIRFIKRRLDTIDRDNAHLKAQLNLDASRTQQVLPPRATSSLVNVAEIYGRDDDKQIIVDWLLSESSHQEIVPILSVVGTGGFGKTTLAQLVFRQEKTRFELSIWVCVSEPFDREKVAKEIIEQATGNKARDFVEWEALHQQLSDSINGKQFLIVLDGVWSENSNDWTSLKLSLNGGAPGSRIIVTTRDVGVAQMMGSRIHTLEGLTNQECRLLFQRIAFIGRSQEECETLEKIGKKLADKCKGVPLIAKTIAGLMQWKQTKIEWRNVLEGDIWKMQHEEDGFLPVLLLGYHDLPSDLKQCFLYCAIFPKGSIIKKDTLVKLWMAQGFLGLDGDKELEIIGGDYFDNLAVRSFFQDFEEDDKGKIIECKMHNLVHDFAQFLTEIECSILEKNDTILNSEKLRHLNAGDIDIGSLASFKVKKLRSLILRRSKPILSDLFCQVRCLRSLDLSIPSLEKLPDEVERLLHLRYLDLSDTQVKELPETMCNLYNLQTLKLNRCYGLCKLPERIGRLLNLRHLECQDTSYLSYFPRGFGKLKYLRTLPKFIVSNASGGCKLEELEDLNLISGGLAISGLRQVENVDEAKRTELQRKENIVSLTMSFVGEPEQMIASENENNMEKRMEAIIEDLQPNINLEQLLVRHYPGLAFPSWMSTMSNIVSLQLYECENCTQLPALGMLTSLVTLSIGYCYSIKKVGVEFLGISESGIQQQTTFPKLRELNLVSLIEWEEWNLPLSLFAQNEILPSLSLLEISICPKLKALPGAISKLPSLDRLRLKGMCWSADILGISDHRGFVNGESMPSSSLVPLFPKLTTLDLFWMHKWEEEIHETTASTISIMPRLRDLSIRSCIKLKVIPNYLFSHNLSELTIRHCPKLVWMQPCNVPSLEFLDIEECHSIDFNPEEELSSEHFPNLRKLEIRSCDLMTVRSSRVKWSNLSHISEIIFVRPHTN